MQSLLLQLIICLFACVSEVEMFPWWLEGLNDECSWTWRHMEPHCRRWTVSAISEAPVCSRDTHWCRISTDLGTGQGAWVPALPLSVVGPWTGHSPSASPISVKWRQGDKWRQASSQDCCPHCLQKFGFVDKPCLTQRHSGYINKSELSHPYLEIWDSGVIFMLHKFIPKKKRLKKISPYKIIFLKFYFESTQRKAPYLTTLSYSFIFQRLTLTKEFSLSWKWFFTILLFFCFSWRS